MKRKPTRRPNNHQMPPLFKASKNASRLHFRMFSAAPRNVYSISHLAQAKHTNQLLRGAPFPNKTNVTPSQLQGMKGTSDIPSQTPSPSSPLPRFLYLILRASTVFSLSLAQHANDLKRSTRTPLKLGRRHSQKYPAVNMIFTAPLTSATKLTGIASVTESRPSLKARSRPSTTGNVLRGSHRLWC